MSGNMSYNSLRLSAESPFFRLKKIGIFVNGGSFDASYFLRNASHYDHVKQWLTSHVGQCFCNSLVQFKDIRFDSGPLNDFP